MAAVMMQQPAHPTGFNTERDGLALEHMVDEIEEVNIAKDQAKKAQQEQDFNAQSAVRHRERQDTIPAI